MTAARVALALVRAAAAIVPADMRAEWRRDWESELEWSAKSSFAQTWRALGAWPHAIWLRADRWRWEMIWQDIRHGARALVRRPSFAIVAVLSLALGIGANASIFSAVRAVLLRPLPFPEPDRLVALHTGATTGPTAFGSASSAPDFVDWRNQSHAFDEMAAVNSSSFALTGGGPAEQIPGVLVTGGFFNVMKVAAEHGRTLSVADDSPGAGDTVVLSHDLWMRRFGGDIKALGTSILLDGTPYQVVGIMPAGFSHPGRSDLWAPLRFTAEQLSTQRGAHYLDIYARLRSTGPADTALSAAASEMRGIGNRLAQQYPNTNRDQTVFVSSLRDELVGDVRRPLLMLLAAVGAVLLIVCANVASLSMTRALGRQREFAIRASLGASRARLARALIVECLLLSAVGTLGGLLLARWITAGIVAASERLAVPFLSETRVDGPVLLFTLGLCLFTTVLCGTLPGWQASARLDLARRMRDDGGQATPDRARQRARGALIVGEAALAVLLLVGAGLLMRSFVSLTSVSLGFQADRVQKFDLSLPELTYSTPAARAAFVDNLVAQIAAQPDVESAAAIFGLPLTDFGYSITALTIDGRTLTSEEQDARSVQVRIVTPDYFRTMGIPVKLGRVFTGADQLGGPTVAVLNEAAVKKLWPGESGIGHSIELGTRMGQGKDAPRVGGEVVGVVADVHDFGPRSRIRPTLYVSHTQFPTSFVSIVAKARRDPGALIDPLRKIVAAMDGTLPVYQVRTMRQLSADAVQQPRLLLLLIGCFAVVAALLAALGIYGLLAHAVGQRTREIGLRIALGADRGQVMRMVVGQALSLTMLGLALGLSVAALTGRLIRDLLFATQPVDTVTYLAVAGAFLAVALLAAWLPARRAARIDPLMAIRMQ